MMQLHKNTSPAFLEFQAGQAHPGRLVNGAKGQEVPVGIKIVSELSDAAAACSVCFVGGG